MVKTRASIKDVAQRAGVSVATVSNAFNHPDQVAAATRARIEQAVIDLNFVTNGSARQLRVGRSQTVGVVVLDLGNPFYTELARGIEDRLTLDDCTMMMCSSDEDPLREARYLRLFAEQRVRGILITPFGESAEQAAYLERLGIPAVWLDATGAAGSSVSVDHAAGADKAVTHLLEQGHVRIGFLNGPLTLKQCRDRAAGARAAVVAYGLDPATTLVDLELAQMTAAAGQAGLGRLLAGSGPTPTAVFCVNDVVAMGAMRECRVRRLAVPQGMAVVGYDDIAYVADLMTPLSSVRQPMHDLGWTAVDLLLSETAKPQHITFTPELIIRTSSDYRRSPAA